MLFRSSPHVTLLDLIADIPERFIPVGFLRLERLSFLPTDPLTNVLSQWVGPMFWIVTIIGAILCLSGTHDKARAGDEARLRALLTSRGGESLSFMSTWPGNSLWFNQSGTIAIAYRVVNGIAITTSDPIGAGDADIPDRGDVDADIPDAVRPVSASGSRAVAEFAEMCDDNGWVPVFYSVHARWLSVFTRMGWQAMSVAEETVLRPRTWETTGKKWQDIRSSINRAEREGVRAVWTSYTDLSMRQSAQIREISELWVQEKDLPELGFTLGGLDELRDPAVRLMLAIDENERVHAVTSWLPTYRDGVVVGWTLDFMRRRPEGVNGVMEFLIAETASMLKEQPEIEFLSLSAAPLAQSVAGDERSDSNLTTRILEFLGNALEPVYGFRSLLAFKRKFQPEFLPLYMAYPDPVALPAIGLALARAYLPSASVRDVVAGVRELR